MTKNNNWNIYIVVLMLLAGVYSCANMARPSGGPIDETPPKFIKSTPKQAQLNVSTKRILLEFDEIVTVEKPSEKVIVSPPQKDMPQIRSLGKKVQVVLKDTLLDNTTYSIDFTDAIQDNNEKNPLGNFSLSFSTGAYIDTMQFSGMVLNARDLEPITGIFVGLHKNLEDTAFTKLRFDRLSATDAYGRFTIRNVSPGNYKIYALKDANRNYMFDMESEDIAFIDSVFIPSVETETHIDSLKKKGTEEDSIVVHSHSMFTPSELMLYSFNEGFRNQYLEKSTRPEREKLRFEFSSFTEERPVLRPINFEADSLWYTSESSETTSKEDGRKSQFLYWITDSMAYKKDSLQIEVTYLRTDSTKQLTLFYDTLKFNFKDPAPPKKTRKKKVVETKPAKKFALEKSPAKEFGLNDTITLLWNEPVASFDSAGITLEVSKDSVWHPMEHQLVFDTLDRKRFYLFTTEDLNETTTYRFGVDSASVRGYYNLCNDSIRQEFKTKALSEYSNLFLTIEGIDTTAFVELINEQDESVMKARVENGTCEIWYAPPGKYYARLVEDLNNNFQWDPGNYKEKRQPEKVYYYGTLMDMRANWDVDQTWNIHALPIDKQKPRVITKNIPEDEKAFYNDKEGKEGKGNNNKRNTQNQRRQNQDYNNPNQNMNQFQGGGQQYGPQGGFQR